jgi:hypothetical protein
LFNLLPDPKSNSVSHNHPLNLTTNPNVTDLLPNPNPNPNITEPVPNPNHIHSSAVFNLSSVDINTDLSKLLELGLNFIPTPPVHKNIDNIAKDIDCFCRKLKIMFHFQDKTKRPTKPNVTDMPLINQLPISRSSLTGLTSIKLPSTWTPSTAKFSANKRLLVTSILRVPYTVTPVKNKFNISLKQKTLLKALSENDNVVVSAADKGGAIVILDKDCYLREAYKQLNDPKYYRRVDKSNTTDNYDNILCILKDMLKLGQINQKQFAFLLRPPHKIKPRCFYLLPKIHKPLDKWLDDKTPPGRPIISDVNSESYFIAKLITILLTPFPSTLPSFVKNSQEFKNRVCLQPVLPNHFLVTADIESLYTNMNLDRCLHVSKLYFDSFLDQSLSDNLIKLLKINLNNNDFWFNNECFIQCFGVAMGKSFAPPLSSLYLADFDHAALHSFHIKPVLYTRYIDDIFFIWTGTADELTAFQHHLNNTLPGIKLSFTSNDSEINFLDTVVYKNDNVLLTKVFFKPTDRHTLLARSSFHPPHTFKGILKSQFIRFKSLCFKRSDYVHACKTLILSLTNRGYKFKKMISLANHIWHKYIPKTKSVNSKFDDKRLFLTLKYNATNQKISTLIKRKLNPYIKPVRIMTAWRAGKNLGAILRKRF